MKDGSGCRGLDGHSELFYKKLAQVAKTVFLDAEAGSHCVAAAPPEQTSLLSSYDSRTKVRAGN
jgi:hypothetical protein